MKIVVVAPEFPPAMGGMEVHAWEVAHYLARRHHVQVVAPAQPATPFNTPFSVVPLLRGRFGRDLLALTRRISSERPDALLVMNAGFAVLGRLTRYPVVTRVVGNDFYASWIGPHLPLRGLFWRLPTAQGSLGSRLRRADVRLRCRMATWGLNGARCILANSSFTSAALARAGVHGPDVHVVLGGVDTVRFHPQSRAAMRARLGLPEGPIITTFARLKPKKGIDTALRAVRQLVLRYPTLIYLVVGEGDDEPRLQSLVTALGLSAHVHFAGRRPHAELPEYLAACDVYVQSSRTAMDPITGVVDVETMGRAVCEAAACGVPVVATRSGGLTDVVQVDATGLLVPEDDPDALAGAVDALLQDPARRERMGRQAVQHAHQKFGWDVVGERTARALDAAVGGPQ